jgi:hypothetical protein
MPCVFLIRWAIPPEADKEDRLHDSNFVRFMITVIESFRTLEKGLSSVVARIKAGLDKDGKITMTGSHKQDGLE